jgi:C4-dicarboxylate transporter, DctM subunit
MEYGAWVGVFVFLGMFALIFLGVPMFISMAGAALVGFWILGGAGYAFQQFSTSAYHLAANFGFAVVPLFVLMSVLAADCGVASASYEAPMKWFVKLRGGLLIAITVASAIFGACCGMPLATIAVFAKTAASEIDKYKYDKSLGLGCIAVTGAVDNLIPPSVTTIIFCILLEQPIGRALVAGIVPGLALVLILIATIVFIGTIRPHTMPKIEVTVDWKEKLASLKLLIPVLFLILLIVGGMYFGVFAPTVAGAIGSLGVLIIAIIRRVKLRTLVHSFYETVTLNTQIYPLVIGGFLFARFITLSGLPKGLATVIAAAHLSSWALMGIVILFYLFVGCVMEFLAIAIVTLPLVFPLLMAAGFDPIVMIIALIMLISIAGITPPVGMGVFVVASVAKVKPELVFKGVLPYFIASMVMLLLIIVFPQIVLWLPDLFYGKG